MKKLLFIFLLLPFIANSQGGRIVVNGWQHSTPPTGCDSVALDFITVTGLTGSDSTAVCDFVSSLKSAGLWTKFKAIYPMVGGTSTTCKYNLKDPQNTDAAFRLTFSGTWSFSSAGADPNGSDGWADTHVNASVHLTGNDRHWSMFHSESTANQGWFGLYDGSSAFGAQIYDGTNIVLGLNTIASTGVANPTNSGYYIGSILPAGSALYKAGSSIYTVGSASASQNLNFYLATLNFFGSPSFFSDRNIQMATLGDGLTSGQAATLTTIVNDLNTALGR